MVALRGGEIPAYFCASLFTSLFSWGFHGLCAAIEVARLLTYFGPKSYLYEKVKNIKFCYNWLTI